MFYHITVVLWNIPTHMWYLSMARQLLSPACSNLQATPTTLAKAYMWHFMVVAWYIHLDLIPWEKIMFIPEPEPVHAHGALCSLIQKTSSTTTI
jgi:hypothetical protein